MKKHRSILKLFFILSMVFFLVGTARHEQYQGRKNQSKTPTIGQLSLPTQNTQFFESEPSALVYLEKNAQNKPSHQSNKLLLGLLSNLGLKTTLFYSRNFEQIHLDGINQSNKKRLLYPFHEFG